MKAWIWAAIWLVLLVVRPSAAQHRPFELDAYRAFVQAHAGLDAAALQAMHDAGTFREQAGTSFDGAAYADSLTIKYGLTSGERELADRHGFMVTERVTFDAFGSAFLDVYKKDLPVFISTDAVLHALHMSYDRILTDTEQYLLIPRLDALLEALHGAVPALAGTYEGVPGMQPSLVDLDVYLTVARTLLSGAAVAPHFAESRGVVDEQLALVAAEDWASVPLFSETCRLMDYSQFTVRGHYTREPELGRYFQAMIWLGRTELYLIAPDTDECRPTDADVQRQTIDAFLLLEALEASHARAGLDDIERMIRLFAGDSDNVTVPHLEALRTATGVARAADLLDAGRWRAFQDTLATRSWAGQRILSQILVNSTPLEPERIQPASAFLLFGQRFVVDSYVTGSVVYDKISHEGRAVKRMLPKTLDVLFALGNDAAAQLLAPEMERYPYAPNLAALRYLIDAYEPDFWQHSLYNGWLGAIRSLNPPADRSGLPAFMQTAAWWQQKMNTQLAAWAQLRHDNLLYAKQSYTGVPGCSYPYSYVEPIPAFYEAVGRFARTASERFAGVPGTERFDTGSVRAYFDGMAAITDTLAGIARKELAGEAFDAGEEAFLKRVLFEKLDICYMTIDGWYTRLFYGDPERARTPDLVVADVHTAPADEAGNMVGWVLHAGTGPVELGVVVADVPGTGPVAFAGPVMSYYEHLSTGFTRLTDEAWQTAYAAAPSHRPAFVDAYLADRDGRARVASAMLATSVDEAWTPGNVPAAIRAPQNYPNPFATETTVAFTIPPGDAYADVELVVYDLQGRRVRRLLQQALPAGHYSVHWDGTLDAGGHAASGTYFCRLRIGGRLATGTLTLVR